MTPEEIDSAEMFVNNANWNISITRDDTGQLSAMVRRQQTHTGRYIVCHMMPNKVSRRAAEMLKADKLIAGLVELTDELKAREADTHPIVNTSAGPCHSFAGLADNVPARRTMAGGQMTLF